MATFPSSPPSAPPYAAPRQPVGGAPAVVTSDAAPTHPLVRALQAVGVGIIAALGFGLAIGFATFFVGTQAGCSQLDDGWCGLGWFFLGIGVAFIAAAVGYLCAGVVWIMKKEPEGRRALPIAMHVVAPGVAVAVLWLVSLLDQIAQIAQIAF